MRRREETKPVGSAVRLRRLSPTLPRPGDAWPPCSSPQARPPCLQPPSKSEPRSGSHDKIKAAPPLSPEGLWASDFRFRRRLTLSSSDASRLDPRVRGWIFVNPEASQRCVSPSSSALMRRHTLGMGARRSAHASRPERERTSRPPVCDIEGEVLDRLRAPSDWSQDGQCMAGRDDRRDRREDRRLR
jgi:hypothetical protein